MGCVYCGFEGDLSNEHWFPAAFGKFRNFGLLKDKVCETCNGATKIAEQALARYGVTGIFRSMSGIRGRHSLIDKRSPYYWPLKGIPALELKVSCPGMPCAIYGEFSEGGNIEAARQLIIQRGSDITALLLPDWVQDPITLERLLSRRGFAGAKLLELLGPHKITTALFRRLYPGKRAVPQIRRIGENIHYVWRAYTGELHARAVSKIAFHYMLMYWGDKYAGSEPEFQAIRDFIQGKHLPYPPGADWRLYAVRERQGLRAGSNLPDSYSHELMLRRGESRIEARLRFFVVEGSRALEWTWKVNLGKAPGGIVWEDSVAHHFMLYPKKLGPWNGELREGEALPEA